jgi:hypothetical protein
MKNISDIVRETHLRKAMKGLVLAVMLLTVAPSSTHADDARNRGREQSSQRGPQNRGSHGRVDKGWRNHEWQAHRHWNRPAEQEPGYIYAPPLVLAPPPEYEAPGINFIIPLHIH